jgi:hypothetical protein
MKQLMMLAGIGFVAFQFLFVMALLAAAKRPTPRFEAEIETMLERKAEEVLELTAH